MSTTFKPGNQVSKSKGRPKGSKNKLGLQVKAAVMAAFDQVGGVEYLANVARDNPQVFCTLLGRIIPTEIHGDPDAPVISSVEIRVINGGV
jgi:hypothetical protein